MGGIFENLRDSSAWDPLGVSGVFPTLPLAGYGLTAFGQLGRRYSDVPDWPWQGYFFPNADPHMPIFGPSPNVLFNMPVLRQSPPPQVPPYVGKDGLPHLDDVDPRLKTRVGPGRET